MTDPRPVRPRLTSVVPEVRDRRAADLPRDVHASFISRLETARVPPLADGPPTETTTRWSLHVAPVGAPAITLDTSVGASASAADAAAEPPPPSAGPEYTLVRCIGSGGMGEVWEAIQNSLHRVVAIKRILDRRAEGESNANRPAEFRQEAFVTARLDHPNIVPIHDIGIDDRGLPVLAMKLVRGRPWDELLARDYSTLPHHEALARNLPVLIAMAQAVAFAHSRGIVHRDLKPSQVIVGDYGEVLLADWGLAMEYLERVEGEDGALALGHPSIPGRRTASNPSGTLSMMAPEQTEPTAENIGPWTDIFLLGGTLYFLLTLSYPHRARSSADALEEAAVGVVEPPEVRAPDRNPPPELCALAMRAMQRQPEDRLASAGDFVAALQDYLSGTSQRREATELVEQARARLDGGPATYGELNDCLALLTRAAALWARHPDLVLLRERAHEAYAAMALEHGDLRLARIQGGQVEGARVRTWLERRVAEAEAALRRRDRQRRAALVASVSFLLLLVIGGGIFSYNLYHARRETQGERDVARAARGDSERLVQFMVSDLRAKLAPVDPSLSSLDDVADRVLDYYLAQDAARLTTQEARSVVKGLVAVGELAMAQGNLAQAETALLAAVERSTAAGDATPGALDDVVTRCAALHGYQVVLLNKGRAYMAGRRAREMAMLAERHLTDANAPAELWVYAILGETLQTEVARRRMEDWHNGQHADRAKKLVDDALVRFPGHPGLLELRASADRLQGEMQRRCGDLPASTAALEHARETLERLADRDPEADQVRVSLAGVAVLLAENAAQMGNSSESRDLLRRAIDTFRPLALRTPPDLRLRGELADSLYRLSDHERRTGNLEAAGLLNTEAIELATWLVERDPQNAEWRGSRVALLAQQSVIASEMGDTDQALLMLQALADEMDELGRLKFPEAGMREAMVSTNTEIASMVMRRGESERARAHLDRAIEEQKVLLNWSPDDTEHRRTIATLYTHYAGSYRVDRNGEKALEWFRKAKEAMAELVARDDTNMVWISDYSAVLLRVGEELRWQGRGEEALAEYREAEKITAYLADRDPATVIYRERLAQTRQGLGTVLGETGDFDGALEALRGSVEVGRAIADADPQNVRLQSFLGNYLVPLANALIQGEEYAEGEQVAREAVGVMARLIEKVPTDTKYREIYSWAVARVALCECGQGRPDAALETVREPLAWAEANRAVEGPMARTATSASLVLKRSAALAYALRGETEAARAALEATLAPRFFEPLFLRDWPVFAPLREVGADLFAAAIARAEEAARQAR